MRHDEVSFRSSGRAGGRTIDGAPWPRLRSPHQGGAARHPVRQRTVPRQYLTGDRSHTITTTVPQHELRFEGFTSPRRDLRFDAATNRVTFLKGSATPPYQSVAAEAATFARQVAAGCWTPAGTLVYLGRGATRYTFVAATSGPCRGDAEVGQAIVDRRTGAVLRREVGRADGSFKEVDVLSFFRSEALTPRTRPLLKFGAHHGAKVVGNAGS